MICKNPKIMDFLKNYEGFALHARYIRFIHPITNKDFEIECLPGHSFNVIKSLLLENKMDVQTRRLHGLLHKMSWRIILQELVD